MISLPPHLEAVRQVFDGDGSESINSDANELTGVGIMPSLARIPARSIVLCNSSTFPSQEYDASADFAVAGVPALKHHMVKEMGTG